MPSNQLSSVFPFSSCLQSFPASGSFQSQLFTSGGQSIGVSAWASVFPMNIQDWFPLGRTGWISLQSKGLSRVFSNTTVQKHHFLCIHITLSTMTKSGKCYSSHLIEFVVVYLLIPSWLLVTPWTAAHHASLSYTISLSLLKLMSVELVMPSNHLILCCPLLLPPSIFPSIEVFPVSPFFASGGQSIWVSASTSVLPMNI